MREACLLEAETTSCDSNEGMPASIFEISYENQKIDSVTFISKEYVDHLHSTIRELSRRISSLEKEKGEWNVPDEAAVLILKELIGNFKKQGKKRLDVFDIVSRTKLPVKQIMRVMGNLENAGVVESE